jgi:peptide/nickel transport system permease protein
LSDFRHDQTGASADGTADVAIGLGSKALTPGWLAWRRFRRHKLAILSAVGLVVIVLLVVFAPVLTQYGATQNDTGVPLKRPSSEHLFGTNALGRDVFTQVLYGGRISLLVGVAVSVIATTVGAVVGAVAGYYQGWIDNLLMRVTDLFLAIPIIVLLIIGIKVPEHQHWARVIIGSARSVRAVVTILTLFLWMPIARVVRGLILSLKEKEFIEAARAAGASDVRLVGRHLLPNCTGPIVVNATLTVAAAILTESALSFLGLGVDARVTPTWGNLLDDAYNRYWQATPWIIGFPIIAIVITVLCVNFLGDGLRDALDPRQAGLSA